MTAPLICYTSNHFIWACSCSRYLIWIPLVVDCNFIQLYVINVIRDLTHGGITSLWVMKLRSWMCSYLFELGVLDCNLICYIYFTLFELVPPHFTSPGLSLFSTASRTNLILLCYYMYIYVKVRHPNYQNMFPRMWRKPMQNTAAQKARHPIYQNLFLESGENRGRMLDEVKHRHPIYQNMCPVIQLTPRRNREHLAWLKDLCSRKRILTGMLSETSICRKYIAWYDVRVLFFCRKYIAWYDFRVLYV